MTNNRALRPSPEITNHFGHRIGLLVVAASSIIDGLIENSPLYIFFLFFFSLSGDQLIKQTG